MPRKEKRLVRLCLSVSAPKLTMLSSAQLDILERNGGTRVSQSSQYRGCLIRPRKL